MSFQIAFFSLSNTISVSSYLTLIWEPISFQHWVIFYCLNASEFIYSFAFYGKILLVVSRFLQLGIKLLSTLVHVYHGRTFLPPVSRFLTVRLLDSMLRVCLTLSGICQTVFQSGCTPYVPTSNESDPVLHFLSSIWCFQLWILATPTGWQLYLTAVLFSWLKHLSSK